MDENNPENVINKASREVAVQVPAKTIEEVKPLLVEINNMGLPLSRATLSDRLGVSVKSSGFVQKIAAGGYYGLLEKDGDRLKITERGVRLVDGDDNAAKESFASSTFGVIAHGLTGRTITKEMVALHLTDRLKVPKSSADRFASTFLQVAQESGLITDDRLDAATLESLEGLAPVTANTKTVQAPKTQKSQPKQKEIPTTPKPQPVNQSLSTNGPSIILHLNTAPLSLPETLELLTVLKDKKLDVSILQNVKTN